MVNNDKNKLNIFQRIWLAFAIPNDILPISNYEQHKSIANFLIKIFPKLDGHKKIYKIIALIFITLLIIPLVLLGIAYVFNISL